MLKLKRYYQTNRRDRASISWFGWNTSCMIVVASKTKLITGYPILRCLFDLWFELRSEPGHCPMLEPRNIPFVQTTHTASSYKVPTKFPPSSYTVLQSSHKVHKIKSSRKFLHGSYEVPTTTANQGDKRRLSTVATWWNFGWGRKPNSELLN